ncbi:hypothetical protein TH25_23755 [Thalassospira profundimaris]|uniref:HTH araC/xylS-type domain-containing protein n=1 Tax=Thalassospira profundimaris TaxID=502049 RepID=A0A367WJ31_9PROT|nr:helix-turn-helix domain-containing protein [Thalassospira profundimaris]RCK41444.1 hypothetical protein TH25_23755 [Thalassospira profundimaris]
MSPLVIEKSVFDTQGIEERLRYDVWRESISCIFNVDGPRESRDPGTFNAVIKSLRVGNLVMAETSTVAQLWQRRPVEIVRDGLDHFMIQLFLDGSMTWKNRYGEHIARAGDMVVFDLACEMQSQTSDFRHVSVIIPRSRLIPLLDHPDHHHMQLLPSSLPLARMLADYIVLLNRNLSAMDDITGVDLFPTVVSMVAACLNMVGPGGVNDKVALSENLTDFRIRTFIENNIGKEDLDVNRICDECGISRSALYRLFREEGGVRYFLREQRLNRAMRELLAYPDQQIAIIAARNGFTHANDFSRAFRRRFGMTPRELRAAHVAYKAQRETMSSAANREYELWLRQIGNMAHLGHVSPSGSMIKAV